MKTKKQLLQNSFFASLPERKQKQILKAITNGRKVLTTITNGNSQFAELHYTIKHYGKMKDVISISTSVLDNPICAARRLDTSTICAQFCSRSNVLLQEHATGIR